MSDLQLPSGDNLLLSAYSSMVNSKQTAPTDLAAEYGRYFVTAVKPAQGRSSVFERFSLVDPTIRTIIQSTTTPV